MKKRREEFVTGRACARDALRSLGISRVAIPVGPRGEPVWPLGVAGSITHCTGYACSVVARSLDVAGLGIDAEPNAPLPDGVLRVIARPSEIARVLSTARNPNDPYWDRLLFCAKEAAFKAWYPLTGEMLTFEDAEVELMPERKSFTVRVLGREDRPGKPNEFNGRWASNAQTIVVLATPA